MNSINNYEIEEIEDEFLFPKKLSFSTLHNDVLKELESVRTNKYSNNLHNLDKKGIIIIHFEINIYVLNSAALYGILNKVNITN